MRYCKSTIFQANHNNFFTCSSVNSVVCDTAKVRFFKQITTMYCHSSSLLGCLRYCKSTIFQANHNLLLFLSRTLPVVCDTAKVRFFKQITTITSVYEVANGCLRYCKSTIFQANHNKPFLMLISSKLFAILQKYDFSSKSQRVHRPSSTDTSCLRYCKSTIFQANHNDSSGFSISLKVVCDTAKVRFFKQITTGNNRAYRSLSLFAILQKYDFSSKSQPIFKGSLQKKRCLRYCKSTIFQANHNGYV